MKFIVNGQDLKRADRDTIASNAVNYPEVSFEFIQYKWQGIAVRVANFQLVETAYNEVTGYDLIGSPYAMVLEKDEASGLWKTHVPMEVLNPSASINRPIKFIVTLWGGSVNTKLVTTNAVLCEVDESYYNRGVTPGEPTEEIWDQLEDTMADIESDIDDIKASINTLNGTVDGIGGEVANARIDNSGSTWASLGNAIRGQVSALAARIDYNGGNITDLQAEVVDARIDTTGNTWASLGNAIRGQIGPLKTRIDDNVTEIANVRGIATTTAAGLVDLEDVVEALENKVDDALKYSVTEIDTKKKWINGETIYSMTFTGYYTSHDGGQHTLEEKILTSTWNYKYTIIDYECDFTYFNAKARSQTVNPAVKVLSTNPLNHQFTLFVRDTNSNGHSSSSNASLVMYPTNIPDSDGYPFSTFYNVTVYYIKGSFSVAPEVRKFKIVRASAGVGTLNDSGKSMFTRIPAGERATVQTKLPFVFNKLIQTFDPTASTYSTMDVTCTIGVLSSTGTGDQKITFTLDNASDVWFGGVKELTVDWSGDLTIPYLCYEFINNGSEAVDIAIGPMIFNGVPEEYINNI